VDGVTGFVVAPRDAGSVAAALDAVLSDPDLRNRLGAAGRARAEAEFAYDALAARLTPLARGDLSTLGPVGFSVASCRSQRHRATENPGAAERRQAP
jgi:hypothetical protein